MILVTGGTGLVGAHLLQKLCIENDQVIAIYRHQDKIKVAEEVFELHGTLELFSKVTWYQADVTDIPSLETIFPKIDYVYHSAAMVSFDTKDADTMRKINIEGTANIVNLCLKYDVKKLCHVSSIATVDPKPGVTLVDESCEWNPDIDHSDYSITKYGAEMEIWRGSQEGLSVVIVNPGVIFGFGNWKANASKVFRQIKNGFPFYTKGITGVVDVADVVNVMVELMNSNIENERFVLVAENKSYQEVFSTIAKALNVKSPKIYTPKFITEIAWRISHLIKLLTFRKVTGIAKYSAKSAHKITYYDGSLITQKVDLSYKRFEDSIGGVARKL